jgi:excisionase family DNA binding protein
VTLEAAIAEALRTVVREEIAPLRAELAQLRQQQAEEGITEAEAARRLKVSVRTIQRWCRRGTLEAVKVDGVRRVLLSGVLARAPEFAENVTRLRGP